MIRIDNLKPFLLSVGFLERESNIYGKHYPGSDCDITVDFNIQKINYPENKGLTISERTTCNFEQNENFVVLECIDRLFEKGYQPKHIELEKKWHLGHTSKGGRADICIYRQVDEEDDDSLETYIIIECKTPGKEYGNALKDLKCDGGQLFSYWQQERSAGWLSLYTSSFENETVIYKAEAISCKDDENQKKAALKDKTILTYEKANSNADLFEAWTETYDQQLFGNIIFRPDSSAYNVGETPLRKKDLIDFSHNDKIVNSFEEILRHNNVSDKENAFNRLIALFICKLVDEIQKSDDDIVDFQYKFGSDTYESLQDRLQRLHKEGMEKFMREEIFYVPDTYAEDLVRQYSGTKRKNMIEELKRTLKILKFYSNNDFAFKEVHNEELFYQNGKIIVEMVRLFERFRIIGSSDIQLLGDLFEQLLNKGFKQNEGQFFTPIPITRFIWDSLPVARLIKEKEDAPKMIDYACGAGHFLTEGVEIYKSIAATNKVQFKSDWVSKAMFGIEKDYRLARVSKISLFMHGCGDANIIFGDGLENYENIGVSPSSFDILVANPPYAVKGFKNHLKLKNNKMRLTDFISNEGSEIETLFVERISQLLKPNGVAAVILPASILSNESNSYIEARNEIILNFSLRAIVSLGGKTFGATSTSTVILFLEKNNEPPTKYKLMQDSVTSILKGNNLSDWEDQEILYGYLETIGVDESEYSSFINGSLSLQDLKDNSYFSQYIDSFQTELQKIKKKRSFTNLSEIEKEKLILENIINFIKTEEASKLLIFSMIYKQTVLLINAPHDNKKQKDFLGYDWSNRKGNEGIVINSPGGKLFNAQQINGGDSLSSIIRNTYLNLQTDVDDLSEYYKFVRYVDLINFKTTNFSKAIKTNIAKSGQIKSQYPIRRLSETCFNLSIGKRVLNKDLDENGTIPVYSANVKEVFGYVSEPLTGEFSLPSVLWGIDGDWMTSFIDRELPFYPTDHCGVIRVLTDDIDPYYLSKVLEYIGKLHGFSRTFRASIERMKEVEIPIPPISIQQNIVMDFKKVDEEYLTTKMTIDEYCTKINEIIDNVNIFGEGVY